MPKLTSILGLAKKAGYWLCGAGVLIYVWRALKAYMKWRAVKLSHGQAEKDASRLTEGAGKAEADWQKQGVETDKSRDSS